MGEGFEIYDEQGRLYQTDDNYIGTLLDRGLYTARDGYFSGEKLITSRTQGIHFVQGCWAVASTVPANQDILLWQANSTLNNVKAWTFGFPDLTGSGFGFEVYNKDGKRTFDSENPYMNVIGSYFMSVGNQNANNNITEIQTPYAGSQYAIAVSDANVYTVVVYHPAVPPNTPEYWEEFDYQIGVWLDSAGVLHAESKLIDYITEDFAPSPETRGSSATVIITDISLYPIST